MQIGWQVLDNLFETVAQYYFTLHYCLYITVLYITVLYNTVLYITVLYNTVLYITVLYNTVQYKTLGVSQTVAQFDSRLEFWSCSLETLHAGTEILQEYSNVSKVMYSTVLYSTINYRQ